MKRFLAVIGAMGLLVGSAVTAKADGTASIPVKDSGTIPSCGNILEVETGVYAGGTMRLEVVLASAPCEGDGVTAELGATASYALYAILDKPSGSEVPDPLDPPHPSDPFSYDIGPHSEPVLQPIQPQVGELADGSPTLTYEGQVDDNDPNICVFMVAEGTVPVTTTTYTTTKTTDAGDHNGNGQTNDDKHRGNEGDNSDGDKHDWETTTTTTAHTTTTWEPYVDRAPWDALAGDPEDEYGCLWLNAISEVWRTAGGDTPSRGFN